MIAPTLPVRWPLKDHVRRWRAFTLIELMVVIAVIALLLAILMPSLNRAREQGKMVKCLSNMRQIGAGLGMYQGYHRGWLPVGPVDKMKYIDKYAYPPKYYDTPEPNTNPYPASNCHWGGNRATYIHDLQDHHKRESLPRPLSKFMFPASSLDSSLEVFSCPSDVGTEEWKPNGIMEPIYSLCGNTFWINPWPQWKEGKELRQQISSKRIRQPANIVLAEEPRMYFGVERSKQLMGYHKEFSKHNMLFLDFHAEYKKVDTTSYYGPGWFLLSYWEIMDYYR